MARVRTDAVERKKQRDAMVSEVAGELGVDHMTVSAAQTYRAKTRSVIDITQRELTLDDVDLQPIGVVLARVGDYKIIGGINAQLALTTNAHEFGDIVHDAARVSHAELLVCALFRIPRRVPGADDDEGGASDGGDWD